MESEVREDWERWGVESGEMRRRKGRVGRDEMEGQRGRKGGVESGERGGENGPMER